jgi:putative hydrolase of the HAD superfamily
MALKAVGFDIDGTLYPDIRAHRRSLWYFIRYMRIISAFSRTRRTMRDRHNDKLLDGDPGEAEVAILAEELSCHPEKAREIRDRVLYQGWEACFRGMKPYRGVREALLSLKNAGLKLAALSDFPVGRKLEFFGLEDLFDVALGYPESRRLKPRPEPFLLMAEKLGVLPREMLYIGKKLEYDVRGAEIAGMRGALIGCSGRRAPPDVTAYKNYRHMADRILCEVKK